jgi:histidinol-phosphate aminotransferase
MTPTTAMTGRVHGGADATGPARWDFSTCANAAGPCPLALDAVRAADPTRYPDPACTAVRQALAALHGVEPWRVLPAVSASEFIQRLSAVGARLAPGAVQVPRHAYGDYATAACAWGRLVCVAGGALADHATLAWHAEPSSPLGQDDDAPPANPAARATVLDAVYAPLRLRGGASWSRAAQDAAFVLHSPNKALGLTGVRGAYAIAPARADLAAGFDLPAWCAALEAAAPSWPLSAQADAMLRSWAKPAVQSWVAASLASLAAWKSELQCQLSARGFAIEASVTPFFVAQPPPSLPLQALQILRERGVAVRDAASFGLHGAWRVSAQPPAAQAALLQAIDECRERAP